MVKKAVGHDPAAVGLHEKIGNAFLVKERGGIVRTNAHGVERVSTADLLLDAIEGLFGDHVGKIGLDLDDALVLIGTQSDAALIGRG